MKLNEKWPKGILSERSTGMTLQEEFHRQKTFRYCLDTLKANGLGLRYERDDQYIVYRKDNDVDIIHMGSFESMCGLCYCLDLIGEGAIVT